MPHILRAEHTLSPFPVHLLSSPVPRLPQPVRYHAISPLDVYPDLPLNLRYLTGSAVYLKC